MDCIFYTFSKKKNSTKKPSDGVTMSVVLKDSTNVTNPTLELSADAPIEFNYAHIFDRYYYIRDWRSISRRIWECELVEDVLASWIDAVKGQSVYAVMSSAHYDERLDDKRVQPVQSFSRVISSAEVDILLEKPEIFVNFTDASSPIGTRVYYGANVASYISEALNVEWYEQLFEKVRGFNPLDLINEIYACALDPAKCHSTATYEADFGTLFPSTTFTARALNIQGQAPTQHVINLSLPSAVYSDFRQSSRFVKYYLHLPYIGNITIPPELLYGQSSIIILYGGDCLSGTLIYDVLINTSRISLGNYATTLKAPLALSRQSNPVAQVAKGALEIGVGVLTGNGVGVVTGAKGVSDVFSGILGIPEVSNIGTVNGSIAPLAVRANNVNAELIEVSYTSSIEPSNFTAISGRPTQKVVTISSGYYECSNASVAFDGFESEITEFNNALNSGVYVE